MTQRSVSQMFRALAVALLLGVSIAGISAQDLAFRNDGQLGSNGRATVSVPVQEGQQLTFRIASLDFEPTISINVNGETLDVGSEDGSTVVKSVRIRQGSTAVVTIQSADSGRGSFQLRVFKQKENPPLSLSGFVEGTISATDIRNDYENLVDYYTLPVKKGQRLVIVNSSPEGDPVLYVELPDGTMLENDDAIGTDSRLIIDVSENGIATVGVSMLIYDEYELGDDFAIPYNLYVREFPATPKPLTVSAGGTTSSLTVVDAGIPPVPEVYSLNVPKSGIYKITVAGRSGMYPGVTLTLANGGERTISGSDSGNTKIEVRDYYMQGQKVQVLVDAPAGSSNTGYTISAVQDGDAMQLKDGQVVEGDLDMGGSNFYLYKGKAGEYVEFFMGTEEFDSLISLVDKNGQELRWDDYFESEYSYASYGGYYFETAGDAVIRATSYDDATEGSFSLTVTSSASGKIVAPQDYPQKTVLAADKPLFTRLTGKDPVIDGSRSDEFIVDLKANEIFTIGAQSRDFDGALSLVDPSGTEVASNDDFKELNPQIEYIATRAGRYTVRLYNYGDDTGSTMNTSYTITYSRIGTATKVGSLVEGYVSEDSDWTDAGMNYEEHSQRLTSGDKVYIVVDSPDFDPIVELRDQNGRTLAENDDYGNGLSARVLHSVTRTANYDIVVINASAEEGTYEGEYTLSIYLVK